MKITRKQLKRIINEELGRVISEEPVLGNMIMPTCYKNVDGKSTPDWIGTWTDSDGVEQPCDRYLQDRKVGPYATGEDEDEVEDSPQPVLQEIQMPVAWLQVLGDCLEEKGR